MTRLEAGLLALMILTGSILLSVNGNSIPTWKMVAATLGFIVQYCLTLAIFGGYFQRKHPTAEGSDTSDRFTY